MEWQQGCDHVAKCHSKDYFQIVMFLEVHVSVLLSILHEMLIEVQQETLYQSIFLHCSQKKDVISIIFFVIGYNLWRKWCGIGKAHTFDDLLGFMPNKIVQKYKALYRYVKLQYMINEFQICSLLIHDNIQLK